MEGVKLEEKCLLLKSADKETGEDGKDEAKEENGSVEEEDGEKSSTAVKLVGQVLSEAGFQFLDNLSSNIFSFVLPISGGGEKEHVENCRETVHPGFVERLPKVFLILIRDGTFQRTTLGN